MTVTRTITTLTLVILASAAGARAGENQLQVHKWWQSEDVRRAVKLTTAQVTQIEQIFQDALPKLRLHKAELDRMEADLSTLLRERSVAEADVDRQIDRVEAARSALSKARTLMLFRIHRVLSVEQNAKLRSLHEREKDSDARHERGPKRPE